jgi:hypothetical protein
MRHKDLNIAEAITFAITHNVALGWERKKSPNSHLENLEMGKK